MSTVQFQASPTGTSDAQFAWRIGQFQPQWRPAVAAVAAQSPALADLAESYPALLFALASGFAPGERHALTVQAVMAGAPLQVAAERLGLAWWTRKLPASAFGAALPPFPIDADFSRRMANLVPAKGNDVAAWLKIVSEAVPAGGRQYTLWIARHAVALEGTLTDAQRIALHAWVWMGWHPGTTGHALVRRPWSADLGIKRVMDEYGCFLNRAALVDSLGEGRLAGIFDERVVHGLTFRPLRTAFDYIAAAAALDNCLEQYAERLRHGATAVALIIADRDVVGCVEIGPHATEAAMPSITQLRTAKNRRASAALWSAAYAWLAATEMRALTAKTLSPSHEEAARVRSNLWGPFLEALVAAPHAADFHARAAAALLADPPRLDSPPPMRRVLPRPDWLLDRAGAPLHETLRARLAQLTGRGAGHRP